MKKIFSVFAVAAILATSCTFENIDEVSVTEGQDSSYPGTHVVTLKASADPETLTSYTEDKYFGWTPGDAISVLVQNPDDSYEYVEFTTTDSGATATFTGTIADGQTVKDLALYPANANHTYSYDGVDETIGFYLATEYDYTVHESVNMPMVGRRSGSGFHFKAAGGALKVSYGGLPANTVFLFQFASDYTTNKLMTLASDKLPACSYDGKGVDAHATVIRASTDASGNATVYYPMPPKNDNGYNRLRIMWDGGTNQLYNQQRNGNSYKLPITVGKISRLKKIVFSEGPAVESDFTMAKKGAIVPLPEGSTGNAQYKRGIQNLRFFQDEDNIYGYFEIPLSSSNANYAKYMMIFVENDGTTTGQDTGWVMSGYKGYDIGFFGKISMYGFDPIEMTDIYRYTRGTSGNGVKMDKGAAVASGVSGTGVRSNGVFKYTFTLSKALAGLTTLANTNIGIALCKSSKVTTEGGDSFLSPNRAGTEIDLAASLAHDLIEIDGYFDDWDANPSGMVSKTFDKALSQMRAVSDGTTLWIDVQFAHASKALTLDNWNDYISLFFDTVGGQGGTDGYANGADYKIQFRFYQSGSWRTSVSLLSQQKYDGGWSDVSNYADSDFSIASNSIGAGQYEFEFSMPLSGLGVTSGDNVKIDFLGYTPEYHSGNSGVVVTIP